MAYIKFTIQRRSDEQGNTIYSRIGRIESDMPWIDTLETNLIYHALSHPNDKVEVVVEFLLDYGRLDNDNDILG